MEGESSHLSGGLFVFPTQEFINKKQKEKFMKFQKIFTSIFVLSLFLPVSVFGFFDMSLKYGSRGDAVIELQDFLQDQGVYSGKIDGRFGLGTRKAVIAFQLANKLSGDGYFGKASREKANSILTNTIQPSLTAEQEETGTITQTTKDCDTNAIYSTITGKLCSSINFTSNTITPAENKNFYAIAKDETMWFGSSTEEAQKLADAHMISIDITPPRIYLQKMANSWQANPTIAQNNGAVYGTMGIWVANMFEDVQPGLKPGSGMGKAEYYIDETLIQIVTAFGSAGPEKISWDTTKYSDGEHKITVKGYDKAGNASTDSISVIIKNNK